MVRRDLLGELLTVDNAAAGEVVRGNLDQDRVAGKNTYVVLPHLSGNGGEDVLLIVAHLDLDPEHGVGQRRHYGAFRFYCINIGHTTTSSNP